MKKIFAFLMAVLMIPTIAKADDEAVTFVKKLADDVITNVLEADIPTQEKLTLFRADFEKALDMKSIGQFVLGVYWKNADEGDRQAFLNAFIDFTTKTWADRFNLYTGQKITFKGSRNAEGKNQFYVDSVVEGNPPVAVVWRLKKTKTGDYKIIDIIVEGVSMAMSYRNEYSAVLQSNGGDINALTDKLEFGAKNFVFTDK